MTPSRHWERFDESSHDNAQQMKEIAENAIEDLLKAETIIQKLKNASPNLAPHDYRNLVNDLRDTAVKYGNTQQLRSQIEKVVSKYVEIKK